MQYGQEKVHFSWSVPKDSSGGVNQVEQPNFSLFPNGPSLARSVTDAAVRRFWSQ